VTVGAGFVIVFVTVGPGVVFVTIFAGGVTVIVTVGTGEGDFVLYSIRFFVTVAVGRTGPGRGTDRLAADGLGSALCSTLTADRLGVGLSSALRFTSPMGSATAAARASEMIRAIGHARRFTSADGIGTVSGSYLIRLNGPVDSPLSCLPIDRLFSGEM